MPAIRTIALRWADFQAVALRDADRDDMDLARVSFYSGFLAALDLLAGVPSGEGDATVRALRDELDTFLAELKKGPPG